MCEWSCGPELAEWHQLSRKIQQPQTCMPIAKWHHRLVMKCSCLLSGLVAPNGGHHFGRETSSIQVGLGVLLRAAAWGHLTEPAADTYSCVFSTTGCRLSHQNDVHPFGFQKWVNAGGSPVEKSSLFQVRPVARNARECLKGCAPVVPP